MLGGYLIKVVPGKLPQKVASGFDKVFNGFTGASYTPIAYLGHQVVNGINHAVLCEQNLVTAKDVKGIAIVVLNEKPGDIGGESLELVEIKSCFTDKGMKLGGINITPSAEIPEDAMKVWNKHFGSGFFGASNKPFALLATQVVHGVAYFYAVESTMIVSPIGNDGLVMSAGNNKSITIVKLFSEYPEMQSMTILEGVEDAILEGTGEAAPGVLGPVLVDNQKNVVKYAFNW